MSQNYLFLVTRESSGYGKVVLEGFVPLIFTSCKAALKTAQYLSDHDLCGSYVVNKLPLASKKFIPSNALGSITICSNCVNAFEYETH